MEAAGGVRATLHLRVRPGREAQFESTWREVAEVVRGLPGNVRQALLRDPHDAAHYVITSDWADESSFRAFERSPEQDELTSVLRSLRESASLVVQRLVVDVEAVPGRRAPVAAGSET